MKMKKVFALSLGLAFLLLCGIPAMAQTVEGPGYAAGSVGQYTYDPYTGQVDVSWSTAYGVNVYGNPATTTTTATVTRGNLGVLINSRNETDNGRSYASGQTTDASRYTTNPCRTEVAEEVNVAASDVDICGTSVFFLEAWSESAHTAVGIAQADGDIEVNHSASNAAGSAAAATFEATSVTDYEGGAFADADIAQVGQEVGMAADVFAQAMAENGAGFTASVTFEGDSVVELEQQATAAVDEVEADQEADIATFATFTNTSAAGGHTATTTAAGHLIINYNGNAWAATESVDLNPAHDWVEERTEAGSTQAFDLAENVTATSTAASQGGNSAESSTTAELLLDYRSGAVAGDESLDFAFGPAHGIPPHSISEDEAETFQSFSLALDFTTSESSESSLGAEAYVVIRGDYMADYRGSAEAETESITVGDFNESSDEAEVSFNARYYYTGPDGGLEWGAATGDGAYRASVEMDPTTRWWTPPFSGLGRFGGGASAGIEGDDVEASAGGGGRLIWGRWNTEASASGPNDSDSDDWNKSWFGPEYGWGGGASADPGGSSASAPQD